jgi:hypothetical protein
MARPESLIQQAIHEYLTIKHIFHFSVPNGVLLGGRNNYAIMNTLKNEGLCLGASDLVVMPKGKLLFCEIKTKIGVQSESQKEFQKQIEVLGYTYLIWRSIDDCINYKF